MMKAKIKKLRENTKIPETATKGDAGLDCYTSIFKTIDEQNKKLVDISDQKYELKPHERVGCGLGFATELPEGWYAQVVPRSGLALWNGLTVTNSPGTIDNGYRNEWIAIMVNTSNKPVVLKVGDKICQFMMKKSPEIQLEVVEELSTTERNLGGFGSTDKKDKK